jgi:hypothetical protein
MKKFLGIGYEFQAVDKGVNKFFDKANNSLEDMGDGLDKVSKTKPVKGSVFDTLFNISALAAAKNLMDSVQNSSEELSETHKKLMGTGISDEFRQFEHLQKRLSISLGDSDKATKVLNKSLQNVVKTARVTEDTALEIVKTFVDNNIGLEKSEKLLERVGKLSKSFRVDAGTFAQSFAFANKTLGFSEKALMDVTDQVTLLASKTNLHDVVGNLPRVFETVQKQIEKGIITPAQAKAQVMRINDLVTGFRNTGVEIGTAQGFIENLTSSADRVASAFSGIIAGESGEEIANIARDFGKLGMNVGDVVKSLKSGNINDAFDQIRKAGIQATKQGGDTLRAYKILIKNAFGEEALGLIASASTKAFDDTRTIIKDVKKSLADGTALAEAEAQFQTLNETIESQELHLKGLQQAFDRNISGSIAPGIKKYNELKVSIMESMGRAALGQTEGFFMSSLVAMEKFRRGGLLPFMDTITKIPGVSEESFLKLNASFDTLGGLLKENISNIFFFVGTFKYLGGVKALLKPFKLFGSLISKVGSGLLSVGSTLISAGGSFFKFSKALVLVTKSSRIYMAVMRGVGLATTFATGPIGIAIAAIAALAGGLYLAYKKSEWFRKGVDNAWAGIKKFGQSIMDIDFAPIWEGLKSTVAFFFEWLTPIGYISKAIKLLANIFPETFAKIKKLIEPIVNLFVRLGDAISDAVKNMAKFTVGTVGKAFDKLANMFGGNDEIKVPDVKALALNTEPEVKSAQIMAPTPVVQAQTSPMAQEQSPLQSIAKQQTTQQAQTQPPTTATPMEAGTLGNIFIAVGQEIINAINNGQKNVSVELKGDANRLFKMSNTLTNNRMVNHGISG